MLSLSAQDPTREHSRIQTCTQKMSKLISRSYTTLGECGTTVNIPYIQPEEEWPHRRHIGRPICRIWVWGSMDSFTVIHSHTYSCVFFSSSLSTCLSGHHRSMIIDNKHREVHVYL